MATSLMAPTATAFDLRYLNETEHPFQCVFFLMPHTEDFSTLDVLFNWECPSNPRPLADLARSSWINLVSSEGKICQLQ